MSQILLDPEEDRQLRLPAERTAYSAWILLALAPLVAVAVNALCLFTAGHPVYSVFRTIRLTYAFDTVLLPCWLILAGAVSWPRRQGNRRRRLALASIASIALGFVCLGARIYATYVEPTRLVVRTEHIRTTKVDRPIRILHISDIQSFRIGGYEEEVFRRMRELRPDLLLFTGDLLQPLPPATLESELPKMAALFQSLDVPCGKFAVCGDVDRYSLARFTDQKPGSLRFLSSKEERVTIGKTRLRILGLSLDESRSDSSRIISDWLGKNAKDDFGIVMGHSPDFVLKIAELPVDLCLAGHTHGGQIVVPFFGPIMTLSYLPRKQASGLSKVGRTQIDVSAGIGTEHAAGLPPIRVNCPPEMTLIILSNE